MFKALASALLISLLLVCVLAFDCVPPGCNCDDEGSLWSIDYLLECQRVSEFLIMMAYFSIPIELVYFINCFNVPFKWVFFQFIAFLVVCGMTHLLNGWTYGPYSYKLMLALTIFKILSAIVSCATAMTLITLIPLLVKMKMREFLLKKKTWELGRKVGILTTRKEVGVHAQMLTQEIRRSLDKHTILSMTLLELSETLGLHYCAIWMPNEMNTKMILTHELKGRNYYSIKYKLCIPMGDPDVVLIKGSNGINALGPNSPLLCGSNCDATERGHVAAIRMPMLSASNFKEFQTCRGILVLVLPRSWSAEELEILKVVADQVAVALSHAAILEESQLMQEHLAEQNLTLQHAKMNAVMTSHARSAFQNVISDVMRRHMHSILGLISVLQDENLNNAQRAIVDAMVRTRNVLSILINDAIDDPSDGGRFPLEMRPFRLHEMIKDAACVAKSLCVTRGFGFVFEVDKSIADNVMGDAIRVFQVILHMVGSLLNGNQGSGLVVFRISLDIGSQGMNDQRWAAWRQNNGGDVYVRFQIGISRDGSLPDFTSPIKQLVGSGCNAQGVEGNFSFNLCKRLVQLMQGNIWAIPNPQGFAQSMALVLFFQPRTSIAIAISEPGGAPEHSQVLITDDNCCVPENCLRRN